MGFSKCPSLGSTTKWSSWVNNEFLICQKPDFGLIGLSSVLRPRQHSMGDGFYRSKDPTNSIKVLKVHIVHRQIKHTIIKQ